MDRQAQRDAIKRMSKLMLEGWTMTAQNCPMPRCNNVVLRDRSGVLYCGSCDCEIRTESAAASSVSSSSSNQAPAIAVKKPQQQDQPPPYTTPSSSSSSSSSVSRTDLASKRMGQKLLSGYAMLAECCSACGTPYLKARGATKLHCVLCDEGDAPVSSSSSSLSLRPPFQGTSEVPSSSSSSSSATPTTVEAAAAGTRSSNITATINNESNVPTGLLNYLRSKRNTDGEIDEEEETDDDDEEDEIGNGYGSMQDIILSTVKSTIYKSGDTNSKTKTPLGLVDSGNNGRGNRATATSSSSSSAAENGRWEAAFQDIVQGADVDARSGPKARVLASQTQQITHIVMENDEDDDDDEDDKYDEEARYYQQLSQDNSHAAGLQRVEAVIASYDHDAGLRGLKSVLASATINGGASSASEKLLARRNNVTPSGVISSPSSSGQSFVGAGAGTSSPSSSSPSAASSTNVTSGSVTIMDAPRGWQNMSPAELSAYFASQKSGGGSTKNSAVGGAGALASPLSSSSSSSSSVSSSVGATLSQPRASTISTPKQTSVTATTPLVVSPPLVPTSSSVPATTTTTRTGSVGLVPGASISMRQEEGNIGPGGGVQFLGTLKFDVPNPSDDLVSRIAAGLARAAAEDREEQEQEERQAEQLKTAKATQDKQSSSSSATSSTNSKQMVSRVISTVAAPTTPDNNNKTSEISSPLPMITTSSSSSVTSNNNNNPSNTSTALQILIAQLQAENEAIIRLSTTTAINDATSETIAAAASRIGKLAAGIVGLRNLQAQM